MIRRPINGLSLEYSHRGSTKRRKHPRFSLSNWTESDIWLYIQAENIPIVPLYFAKEREVVRAKWFVVVDPRRKRTFAR